MKATEIQGNAPELLSALTEACLPTEDITEAGRTFYVFHDVNGGVLGYGGLETHGTEALLRSVVVTGNRRGQGIGVRLVNWLFDRARAQGCLDVYMLTTTAERLGKRCGFQRIDRENAPQAIRYSRQMASLCPAAAVLMHRKGAAMEESEQRASVG